MWIRDREYLTCWQEKKKQVDHRQQSCTYNPASMEEVLTPWKTSSKEQMVQNWKQDQVGQIEMD